MPQLQELFSLKASIFRIPIQNGARENFLLNSLPLTNNPIVREDCLQFLEKEREIYDLIVIDPPTISRSKKMDQMFDIQKDYPFLISKALALLSRDGTLIFSTNSRDFDFDESLFDGCTIVDISKKTIPIDFHNQKIHRCWKISLTYWYSDLSIFIRPRVIRFARQNRSFPSDF